LINKLRDAGSLFADSGDYLPRFSHSKRLAQTQKGDFKSVIAFLIKKFNKNLQQSLRRK